MASTPLLKLVRAGCFGLIVGIASFTGVAQAQDGGGTVTTQNEDDGFDWGWLGLLGLIGLAGLAGRKRHDHDHVVRTDRHPGT